MIMSTGNTPEHADPAMSPAHATGLQSASASAAAPHAAYADQVHRAAQQSYSRKDDHVRLANSQHEAENRNSFDDVRFIHNSFPDIAVTDIDLHTDVLGARWELPFYINAMTGGSKQTGVLNASLAEAANATGISIASGSQHAALRDSSLTPTFATLREHTRGFLIANVGPSVTAAQAQQAVEMIDADALQVHVNAAQEIVMPEGDRDFRDWKASIDAIAETVQVPVIVKEVGFGMSQATIRYLYTTKAAAIDVSGKGGTDFITIENQRRKRSEFSYMTGWGESTVLSLMNVATVDNDVFGQNRPTQEGAERHCSKPQVIASGGVRTPLDVAIALSMGAQAVGVSGHFLHTLIASGTEGLIAEIERWKQQLGSIMTLLGARSLTELSRTDLVITGETAQEAEVLGISLKGYANRSVH
ncbi:type 2 isopentenyl-diphosphate Delta-isomerase [Bifidobacterium aquikefiri]|uniref:type 2 isopentenyl-diphosphate Delta-isomerase n=2 Tax=Bifidobacterium aquikefiri TaxID=1653207 RepID=UPI0039E99C91